MEGERQPLDPTRRLLKVFGVKVTDYEERTAKILGELSEETSPEALVRLAAEAIELTVDLNERLRETSGHVLDTEAKVLSKLQAALEKAQG